MELTSNPKPPDGEGYVALTPPIGPALLGQGHFTTAANVLWKSMMQIRPFSTPLEKVYLNTAG